MNQRRTDPGLIPTVPFTRAQARSAGITVSELYGPRFQKVFYDLYISSQVPVTAAVRVRAALQISPADSFASHETAAELWGVCVPTQPMTHVSVVDGTRSRRRGIRGHLASGARDVTTHRGVLVSSPAQTFLELANRLSLVDLVVLGDSLVAKTSLDLDTLIQALDAFQGRDARLARRAARLVRIGVDSPMESRLRMLIVLAGLPEPRVNVILRDRDGSWLIRFDLSYPDLKIAVEYDGRQHAEDDTQWARDIDRREDLDRLGWRLIVVRSTGIYVQPDVTLVRIVNTLKERGVRRLALRREWQLYFPVRDAAA